MSKNEKRHPQPKRERGGNNNGDDGRDSPPPGVYGELWDKATCPVDIYVDAFIPFERFPIIPPAPSNISPRLTWWPPFAWSYAKLYHAFSGDNRGFQKHGSIRLMSQFFYDLDSESPSIWHKTKAGISTAYYNIEVAIPPVIGVFPIPPIIHSSEQKDKEKASDDFLDYSQNAGKGWAFLEQVAEMNNPLVHVGGPGIDWRFVFELTKTGNQIKYDFHGNHNSFPAYSIYIKDERVYGHMPSDSLMAPLGVATPTITVPDTVGSIQC